MAAIQLPITIERARWKFLLKTATAVALIYFPSSMSRLGLYCFSRNEIPISIELFGGSVFILLISAWGIYINLPPALNPAVITLTDAGIEVRNGSECEAWDWHNIDDLRLGGGRVATGIEFTEKQSRRTRCLRSGWRVNDFELLKIIKQVQHERLDPPVDNHAQPAPAVAAGPKASNTGVWIAVSAIFVAQIFGLFGCIAYSSIEASIRSHWQVAMQPYVIPPGCRWNLGVKIDGYYPSSNINKYCFQRNYIFDSGSQLSDLALPSRYKDHSYWIRLGNDAARPFCRRDNTCGLDGYVAGKFFVPNNAERSHIVALIQAGAVAPIKLAPNRYAFPDLF